MGLIQSLYSLCRTAFLVIDPLLLGHVKQMAMEMRRLLPMKMGEIIPGLRRMNVYVKHAKPDKMTKDEFQTVFRIVEEILKEKQVVTPEDELALAEYKQSFLKRRILHQWERQRRKMVPKSLLSGGGKSMYREVFAEMEPLFVKSFFEDYKGTGLAFTPFAFRAFIWNQAYIAKKFKLARDCQYWNEMLVMIDALKEQCFDKERKIPVSD